MAGESGSHTAVAEEHDGTQGTRVQMLALGHMKVPYVAAAADTGPVMGVGGVPKHGMDCTVADHQGGESHEKFAETPTCVIVSHE